MVDITKIPIEELKKDLQESIEDIANCKFAIKNGIAEYSGGLVEERIRDNKHFVEVITEELNRRKLNE
jgi:hypothetical protein